MTVTIQAKEFFPHADMIPGTPLIEPCEEYPYGVPEVPDIAEVIEHWQVDCIVENATGTRVGREWVSLGADATDEDIMAYIEAAYALLYQPPQEA